MTFTSFTSFKHIWGTRRLYKLTKPLSWDIGRKHSHWTLIVPVGFEVDVSAPRWLEWLIDVHSTDLLAAATVHDLLLEDGFDKAFASSEFRRCLVARGLSGVKAWAFFFAILFWTVDLAGQTVLTCQNTMVNRALLLALSSYCNRGQC